MVSSDTWADIDSSLAEIFMMIPVKTFLSAMTDLSVAGLSAMTVADLLQLPSVQGKLIFFSFLCNIN